MPTMQTKAISYYADFFVYPVVLAGLAFTALRSSSEGAPVLWMAAAFCGAAIWTLAEYLIHRVILHNVGYFRNLHEQHHAAPVELISTPIWLSLSVLAVVALLPSIWLLGMSLGCGFTFGLTLGYLSYSFMHHVLHHWQIAPGSYLYEIKRRHALHHHRDDEGNFGVTNLFWDRVFGTVLSHSQKR